MSEKPGSDSMRMTVDDVTSFKAAKTNDVDVVWYRQCRVVMAIVSAWGYVFFYLLRIDLSMAIVCMARDPPTASHAEIILDYNNSFPAAYLINNTETRTRTKVSNFTDDERTRTGSFINHTQEEDYFRSMTTVSGSWSYDFLDNGTTRREREGGSLCEATGRRSTAVSNTKQGELEWSKELRGYVLSSFFYGYIVTQVPGGWLAQRYGGKRVFGGGVLITVVATMLVPVAARAHAYYLIVLRVIMGLGCGVGFPATHHLYAQWIPPLERSRLVSFSHAGTFIGTIIALFLSGILCDLPVDNGWPLIFYIYGIFTFAWLIFWQFLVYDTPSDHPRIDRREKEYIISSIGQSTRKHDKNERIPWLEIFKSPPVWAIITAHSCNNWANYTILTSVPMYMKEVLQFDVKQNGALSALPYMLSYFAALGAGAVADFLISRRILSVTSTRKLCQALSSAVPAVLITAMGFINCELRYFAVSVLCFTLVVNSLCRSGFSVNHIDLSPRLHAGILFGISNTVATVPGMLSPMVVGILTPHGTREEWLNVFYICSAFFIFSTIIYSIFASAEEQPWANPVDICRKTSLSNGNTGGVGMRVSRL